MAERRLPDVEKDNVVGFNEVTTELIHRLTANTEDLQVISIIGMPGLGKTTLANKVYNDPRVLEAFSTQAWIYVSQSYTKTDLLLSILKSGNQVITATDEKSLVKQVCGYLTWTYLIVVDDVWDKKDWDSIKEAFPNYKNRSRILLTSRNEPVAVHANPLRDPYKLDFLTVEQSLELLQIKKYISSKPCGLRVRSFLCFAKDQVNLPREHEGCIPEEFKLLRVYHIKPISSPRFPSGIDKLVHLTYVAFSGDFTTIPPAMSKLWNLQTLIVETTSRTTRTIDVKADILKMSQFRHLHTNKASKLHGLAKTSKDASSNKSVQTLATITPESCTGDVLGQTPCLKKLGIHGKLATLLEGSGSSLFDNLTKLEQLVTLKLSNDVFPDPPSESRLQGLPQWFRFPPNLERLTLADTFLDWKHMYVLGMLPELEELKLKDNAFTGESWNLLDGGFKKLKALQIWKTDLVFWKAKAEHFPSLQHVFLRDCTKLVEIPSSLGKVETLRTIKLHRTSSYAATSARKIKQQYNGLKVEIFPPDLGQGSSPGW
ncbi:hypothetical protein C3L33_14694, partial [Rhododendron williamsianum]